jgi:hypothetical protein
MKFEDGKPNREWLLRYVLGEMSEEEMHNADTRFFSDDTFASTLDETYRDLLDAYAAGEIAESEKERVERAFLAAPHQVRRLKVSQAMRSLSAEAGEARRHLSVPRFISFWPVAVSAGVLSLVIAVVFYQHNEKSRDLAKRDVPANSAAAPGAPESLAPPPGARVPAENAYTILLLPDVTRGDEAGESFAVPASATEVVFQIVISPDQKNDAFEVRLRNSGSRPAHVFSGLRTQMIDTQKYVQFRLPSGDLPADNYAVDVFRSTALGQPVEQFVVHVTRASGRQ